MDRDRLLSVVSLLGDPHCLGSRGRTFLNACSWVRGALLEAGPPTRLYFNHQQTFSSAKSSSEYQRNFCFLDQDTDI